MRGNSFANGECNGGSRTPYRWDAGYQAPRPVTIYTYLEPHPGEQS